MRAKKFKFPFFFVCALMLTASIALMATVLKTAKVEARGRIVGVRVSVWQDINATVPLEYLDWGMIEPNETKDHSCYVKSESNVPVNLTLTTENWTPLNGSDFLTLSWDYNETLLYPDEVRSIALSLYVHPDVGGIDEFSFDIIVTGTKHGWGT